MDQRKLLTYGILIAICALSFWWLRTTYQSEPSEESSLGHEPDLTMDDFTATEMDLAGLPAHSLSADFMKHFADDGTTEYVNPHLTFFRADGAPWHIFSDTGWMSKKGDLVLFLGKVEIIREQSATNRPIKVITEDLHVRPKDRTANTEKPVNIVSDNMRAKGVGMRADWNLQRLELLSKARGDYEPIPKPITH